jgi:hypothetical protein
MDDLDMAAVAARLGKSKSWLQYEDFGNPILNHTEKKAARAGANRSTL